MGWKWLPVSNTTRSTVRLELQPREAAKGLVALAPAMAVAITVTLGGLLFAALGNSPVEALRVFFIDPLRDPWSVHELAVKAAPLILIAAGLTVCFRSANWNIGAEGQFVVGAIAASMVPILAPDVSGPLVLPAMAVLGMFGGLLWASIPAVLKNRFGASEILVSLMLVYIAELLLDYLVRGPWRNPAGFNFPESAPFQSAAIVPELISTGAYGGRAHWGIVVAIVAAVVVWLLVARTVRGYGFTVSGASPRAARFAGFDPKRTTFVAFAISGALAGLAGMLEVSGAIGQLRPSISPGYGFTAIIVAFLARLNPLGTIVAGFIVALSFIGGEAAQVELGISERVARVFQGILLFSILLSDTLIRYRPRLRGSRKVGVRAGSAHTMQSGASA